MRLPGRLSSEVVVGSYLTGGITCMPNKSFFPGKKARGYFELGCSGVSSSEVIRKVGEVKLILEGCVTIGRGIWLGLCVGG